VLHFPIKDFGIPRIDKFVYFVSQLTQKVADGSNCLVHCAGGQGRTGLIICGLLKLVGVNEPLAQARTINQNFVETKAQEQCLQSMPICVDTSLSKTHPILVKAITFSKLLQFAKIPKDERKSNILPDVRMCNQMNTGFLSMYRLLDDQRHGYISEENLAKMLTFFVNTDKAVALAQLLSCEIASNDNGISANDLKLALCTMTVNTIST